MGSGFGAGGGADMLQEVLRRKFTEALAQQKLNEDMRQADMQHRVQQAQLGQGQQRIGLEGERLGQEQKQFETSSGQAAQRLGMEQELQPVRIKQIQAQTEDLNRQPQERQDTRAFREKELGLEHANRLGEINATGANALRVQQARPAPTMVVPTGETDASGGQMQQVVPKTAGTTFAKAPPVNASLDTRLQSAKAVTQTGNDIITMLRDPKVSAMLGPAMSRYNSVADFVGNPPPEFAKLAGQIESYSLANMGVHGMRSANGAEAIKQTVGAGRHTPESMIAVLEGLNGFANHLLENNHRGETPAAGGGAKPDAASLIKKYGG